ncbi:MAG TPA: hypothetical protein VM012_03920 [Flavitalea sp.]|nr:hypothetical protein [Flavitalea sp.]
MKKIERDKWRHFFVGIAMGAFLQFVVLWLLPVTWPMAVIIPLILVVAISYGFELFSKFTRIGYYELLDAAFSIIGGILGMSFILFLKFLIFN